MTHDESVSLFRIYPQAVQNHWNSINGQTAQLLVKSCQTFLDGEDVKDILSELANLVYVCQVNLNQLGVTWPDAVKYSLEIIGKKDNEAE